MRDFIDIRGRSHSQFEHEGQKVTFDGCSSKSLEDATKFYEPDIWQYLGSGYIAYYDGVKNTFKELHHFFSKKQN